MDFNQIFVLVKSHISIIFFSKENFIDLFNCKCYTQAKKKGLKKIENKRFEKIK